MHSIAGMAGRCVHDPRLLDSDDHDVDYFYTSRLPGGGTEGVEDILYHIFEPCSVRASLRYRF